MKILRYCALFLCLPFVASADTHVINQTYFLESKPYKAWASDDKVIVLGAGKTDIKVIAKARKKFARFQNLYWLLSDDQWHVKKISLDKDQWVLDFVDELKKTGIHILPENLCPEPAVFKGKNNDIIVIDSSWILFPHQAELFKEHCSTIDSDHFYNTIEQAIINARLKPVIIISHHGIHPKLIYGDNDKSIVEWARNIHESLGPMEGISNPAYQKYQDKMNKMISKRPNTLFISANVSDFFRDSTQSVHHVALSQTKSNSLLIADDKSGTSVASRTFKKPIRLKFNDPFEEDPSICTTHAGSMHDFKLKGKMFRYFLGGNYRKLWNDPITVDCFNLQKQNLHVTAVGGSLRSPDFQLKDTQGKYYKLRPLRKEVRLPEIFRETFLEQLMLDQQSSLMPVGYILAASLAKEIGIPQEYPRLVYIDINQKAFAEWKVKDKMSGYYQLLEQPVNILKDPEWIAKGIKGVYSTRDMVHRLENTSTYKVDQRSYVKSRLFDLLIGDWDRYRENWAWILVHEGQFKVFKPYPIDRDAAFYRGEGEVSWWRRRTWLEYKYQTYGRNLKNAEGMMVQSLSMDHRFTSELTSEDWDQIIKDFQKNMSRETIEKVLQRTPINIPIQDQQWIVQSFQNRLEQLPQLAMQMRSRLRESVDVVGTGISDRFTLDTDSDGVLHITGKNERGVFFENAYAPEETREIRLYGLNGNDDFRFDFEKPYSAKIRLVPGEGMDRMESNQGQRPRLSLFDDDVKIDSKFHFHKYKYDSFYNEFYSQVNQRKLNVLGPILFLASSNPDSGFTLGGGLKYRKAGFQKAPWASTNELKANAVLNRAAATIMYQGVWFDVFGDSDFMMDADAGLPRFYGSFFGLGNNTPGLNPTFDDSFYWIKAHNLETNIKMVIPTFQYFSVIPKIQFRLRDHMVDSPSFLTDPTNNLDAQLGAGTIAQISQPNYYLGGGITLQYLSDDHVSGPIKKRIVRAEATWMTEQGLVPEDGLFHVLNVDGALTGYFRKSKTQWRMGVGLGSNFGDWEFFDAQFLGNGQNLRGFFMNRYGGKTRVYDSIEINQSLLFKKSSFITDFGLGTFLDQGRVFMPGDINPGGFHHALGGQGWITILNLIAFKIGYAHPIFEDQKGFWSFVLTTEL